MMIVGYILFGLGVLAIVGGIAGAAIDMWTSKGKNFSGAAFRTADLIKILPELFKFILALKAWTLLIVVGAALAWFGIYILQGGLVALG